MKVYFNFLADGEKPKAMYFLTNTGSFYAESTDSGLIGKDLLYNEYMFHFEGNLQMQAPLSLFRTHLQP